MFQNLYRTYRRKIHILKLKMLQLLGRQINPTETLLDKGRRICKQTQKNTSDL